MSRYPITLLSSLNKGLSRQKCLPSVRLLSHPSSSHQDLKHKTRQGPSNKPGTLQPCKGLLSYLLTTLEAPSFQRAEYNPLKCKQLHLTCRSSCPLSVMERGASKSFSSVSVSRATWVLVTAPARGSRNTYFLYLRAENKYFSDAALRAKAQKKQCTQEGLGGRDLTSFITMERVGPSRFLLLALFSCLSSPQPGGKQLPMPSVQSPRTPV